MILWCKRVAYFYAIYLKGIPDLSTEPEQLLPLSYTTLDIMEMSTHTSDFYKNESHS